jgi:lipid-A-disaccharide synthase
MTSILIVAGENSGEKYGADVISEFKKRRPSISFFGIGGKRMRGAGAEIIFPIEELSAIGIVEVLARIPHFKKIFSRLEKEIEVRKPLGAVLIDSPDFNLRLARRLKNAGIPVLYYISPTVWAWRTSRLKIIKKFVTRMCLIFPFELKLYQEHEISAAFVGHPLKEKVEVRLGREEFLNKYSLTPDKRLIALLPGSRRTELENHLPILVNAVNELRTDFPAHFLLVLAESLDRKYISRFLPLEKKDIQVLNSDGYEAMAYSDLVLSACGTANLEAALLGTPLIAFYRVSPFTYYPFRGLLKIKDYSIVNILAGKRIVPELIQRRFTAENLVEEAKKLLSSEATKAGMKAEFHKIGESLGGQNASANVAAELEKVVFPTSS